MLFPATGKQEHDTDADTQAYHTEEGNTPAFWTAPSLPPLPQLAASPTTYSGCCLALSTQLVAYIRSLLTPPPCIAVSIGSGFGLLEAYIMTGNHGFHVIGVEVEPSPNKYLPSSHHRIVHGTRFLEPLVAQATTWLFVYPRRVGLVQEYMAAHGQGSVEKIIWAGPKADWDDYKPCFAGWHLHEQDAGAIGGQPWELIAVASKTST
ncbi:hypothetical protein yc1106_07977 [Curvularia clavata]|uniref:Uncharacterized protein n=1 Tax=Curvularia clavata TaxID=95742 RepID=A0A9Q8ZIE7_CURCL|nr:hypothetical protein yc1106_07977 [Curvularia clavata]